MHHVGYVKAKSSLSTSHLEMFVYGSLRAGRLQERTRIPKHELAVATTAHNSLLSA
jgi:gamma-glutamylcyclotransferase (GGCT)/AIG2-like uncharacterized protein YtfP